jgi:hypothetical protein
MYSFVFGGCCVCFICYMRFLLLILYSKLSVKISVTNIINEANTYCVWWRINSFLVNISKYKCWRTRQYLYFECTKIKLIGIYLFFSFSSLLYICSVIVVNLNFILILSNFLNEGRCTQRPENSATLFYLYIFG